jgi:hypothetical protein
MYSPDPYVLPLHRQWGEVQASVGTTPVGSASGYVSATPLPHLVLTAAGTSGGGVPFEQHRWEVGAGAYAMLHEPLSAEVLVGWGRGQMRGQGQYVPADYVASYNVNGRMERRFVQVDVGIADQPVALAAEAGLGREVVQVAAGAGLRLSQVRLSRLTSEERQGLPEATEGLFLEPAITQRIDIGGVGIRGVVGASLSGRSFEAPYTHIPFFIEVGIIVLPDRFFRLLANN